MKITYDKEANAAYIYLKENGQNKVHKTYCCDPTEVNGVINLDFDDKGQLLGIEILDANKVLHKDLLTVN